MSWEWDAPDGVYKNHALSPKIREAATADSHFMQFLTPEPNYGMSRGETITVTRIMPLSAAGRVSETRRLPTVQPLIDTISVSVSEWGNKLEVTSLEKDLTHYDLTNRYQRVFRDQMRRTMDIMGADALKRTPVKASNNAGTLTIETVAAGGPITDVGTANLTINNLRDLHDYMQGDLKSPKFANDRYVGILSTSAARGIKNDSTYESWQSHTTREPFLDGQLRDVEGFSLFETNHYEALANAIGTNGTGEAIFFGDDPGFLALVEDPELRAGLKEDLGRFHEVGWVGTIEASITWDVAQYARVVHFTSA